MRLLRSEEDVDRGRGGRPADTAQLARRWYGDRLDPDWRPRTRDESQAILDRGRPDRRRSGSFPSRSRCRRPRRCTRPPEIWKSVIRCPGSPEPVWHVRNDAERLARDARTRRAFTAASLEPTPTPRDVRSPRPVSRHRRHPRAALEHHPDAARERVADPRPEVVRAGRGLRRRAQRGAHLGARVADPRARDPAVDLDQRVGRPGRDENCGGEDASKSSEAAHRAGSERTDRGGCD